MHNITGIVHLPLLIASFRITVFVSFLSGWMMMNTISLFGDVELISTNTHIFTLIHVTNPETFWALCCFRL